MILASGRAPFTLATQLFGLEKFSKLLYKNPDLVHKILEFTTELSTAYFKMMLEAGNAHGAFIADPSTSGDVKRATKDCIKKGIQKNGFVLLPGCDLAGGVPEENIKLFIKTAHEEVTSLI